MIYFLIIITLLIFIQWLLCKPFKWSNQGIHWLIPKPIFGNTATSLTRSYFDFWLDFYKETDGHRMVGFHLFQDPALLIRHPSLLKQIMITESDNFNEHHFYIKKTDVFKLNLFNTIGEEWKQRRTKMTKFFTPSSVKSMLPIMNQLINNYIDTLEKESRYGIVDVDKISLMLSTDTIISCLFGLEPECFRNSEKSFFFQLQKEIPGFIFGLRNLLGFLSPTLYSLLGLTAFRKETNETFIKLISQIVELRSKGEGVRNDFIQGMVELYHKEQLNQNVNMRNSDGTKVARFDLNGITAQAMVLFAAGTDTTAHTLSFLLYELAIDQNAQNKVRNEINKVKNQKNGEIGYDDIQEMQYLNMVVNEVHRLYPAAPFVPRKCTKETTLDGIKIEVGTVIGIDIVGIQRDPNFFPDPDKFNPERFSNNAKIEVGTYLPFGLGPRTCIGMRIAEIELKLAICAVLQKFQVIPCRETPTKLKYGYGPTVGPLNGLKLHLKLID